MWRRAWNWIRTLLGLVKDETPAPLVLEITVDLRGRRPRSVRPPWHEPGYDDAADADPGLEDDRP